MQEVGKFEIDGEHYEIYHISPLKALPLGARIAKMIAAPIGGAFKAGNIGSVIDNEIDLGNALKEIAALDEVEFTNIVKELLSCVRLGTGMELNVDLHFNGRLKHMMNVAVKSLQHNYKDFFEDLKGKLGGFIRRATPGITTPEKSESNGQSGGSSSQGSQRSKK